MAVSFWVKYKTKSGKEASRAAYKSGVFNDSIDYDSLAALYPDMNWLQCDNFPELQNKFLEEQKKIKEAAPSIADIKENSSKTDDIEVKKRGRGRPKKDLNLTKTVHSLKRVKNGSFSPDILQKYNNPDEIEVLQNNDLYISLLSDTVDSIKTKFFADNPELIKRHPSNWFRYLCNEIKKNSPKCNYQDNPDVISKQWDIYSDLCLTVGINRTIENFQIFTGLHWAVFEKLKSGSSPEYIDVTKKIYTQCRGDIVGGLSSSYGSNSNQIFIAKSVYGLSENSIITHISAASNVKKIDDIPVFCIDQNEKSK